jgi:hypothetical protein
LTPVSGVGDFTKHSVSIVVSGYRVKRCPNISAAHLA